jgi:hypothetical protein
MNFRQATDALLEAVTLEDLANAMGVSVQAVRQARVAEGTKAHRSPPPEWQAAVIELAEARAKAFSGLARQIRRKRWL